MNTLSFSVKYRNAQHENGHLRKIEDGLNLLKVFDQLKYASVFRILPLVCHHPKNLYFIL